MKIDQSFVGSMLGQPRNMEIVRAIVGLARGLGLKHRGRGDRGTGAGGGPAGGGMDYGQGYYFARPIAEAEIMARLQAGALGFRPRSPEERADMPLGAHR